MDAAERDHFTDLTIVTPCCGTHTTLNDLVYDWPQGFARWRVEVMTQISDYSPPRKSKRSRTPSDTPCA
jgi:hypothetical protein